MTGYGPDDPSEAPTGQYNYSDYGQQQPEPGSTPWHRKPAALIGLGVLAAILIALVIYGIVELTQGVGSTSPSRSSTTAPAVTTTEPVAPAPATTLTEVPTTSAETTTAPATTPPTSTSTDDGRHHHHRHDGGGMP